MTKVDIVKNVILEAREIEDEMALLEAELDLMYDLLAETPDSYTDRQLRDLHTKMSAHHKELAGLAGQYAKKQPKKRGQWQAIAAGHERKAQQHEKAMSRLGESEGLDEDKKDEAEMGKLRAAHIDHLRKKGAKFRHSDREELYPERAMMTHTRDGALHSTFYKGKISHEWLKEDEQIDEISKALMGRYVYAASRDVANKSFNAALKRGDPKKNVRRLKRLDGIKRVSDRLQKEEQIDEAGGRNRLFVWGKDGAIHHGFEGNISRKGLVKWGRSNWDKNEHDRAVYITRRGKHKDVTRKMTREQIDEGSLADARFNAEHHYAMYAYHSHMGRYAERQALHHMGSSREDRWQKLADRHYKKADKHDAEMNAAHMMLARAEKHDD